MIDLNRTAKGDHQIVISAILITRNEALQIADCIRSIAFCDEIIVIDNGSTDQTVEIAKNLGCRVTSTSDWPGFGAQKQRALNQAKGRWVLSIDADERVTPELRHEIEQTIQSSSANGYLIKRKSRFLGRWMRFGGWYPDYVLRLAQRDCCRFDLSLVHEKIIVSGSVKKLHSYFLHFSYNSINDVLNKQRRYALIGAEKIRALKGSNTSVWIAFSRALWTFLRLYILRLGVLEGSHGFISAMFKAQEVFWKYVAVKFENPDRNSK